MRDKIVAIVINLYTLVDIAERLKYKRVDIEMVDDKLQAIQSRINDIEIILNEIDSTEEIQNNFSISNN